MKPDEFKLWDDDASAVSNGTPFRVSFMMGEREKSLYFATSEKAFQYAQDRPELDNITTKNCKTYETLFPKETK